MRVIFIFLLALVTTAQAQQINPVPDYIFRNQMSVGRNAATDSMAYFSVGPKYGAVKGMMPPMVTDTASVTGAAKRNGLLIFSIQKNNFLYWDSVRVRWSDITPTVDTTILATRRWRQKGDDSLGAIIATKGTGTVTSVATGYGLSGGTITTTGTLIVDTSAIATRSRVQKGIDSVASVRVGGTGTTNRSAKFTAVGAVGNGSIADSSSTVAMTINTSGNVGIGTTASSNLLNLVSASSEKGIDFISFANPASVIGSINYEQTNDIFSISNKSNFAGSALTFSTANNERLRILSGGNIGIGNTSPSYRLDVSGSLRNTTGAAFATSSGNVLVGTTTDAGYKMDVNGTLRNTTGANFATSSGNVGVGLAAAGQSGFKTIEIGGSGVSGLIDLYQGTNKQLRIYNSSENSLFGNIANNGSLLFQTTTIGGSLNTNLTISGSGNVGIGNTSPSEKLHVTGRIRATTIDSTATGMNMLYADANGVIKKAAVPSGGITGTGITGYFPKWTGASSQDTSQLFQLGRNIGIGTATPTFLLHLPDANTTNQAMIAGTVFGSDGNGQMIKPSNSEAMTIYGQNDAGYLHGSVISLVGRWGVNTTSLSDAVFTVNGDVKIVTIDSTSTARNMLYQDANGVIKKAAVPSGGGGGITTLAAIGSTPNANGATISGSTLNLEPASGSFGGVVTTGTQTFAGAKTFSGGVNSTNYVSVIGSTTDVKYLDIDRYHVDSAGAHFIGDDNGSLGFGANGLSINSSGTGSRLWLQSFGSGRSTIIGGTTVRTDRLVIHGDNSASDIIGAYSDDLDTAFKVLKNGQTEAHKAVAFRSASEAVLSANYTVSASDYFVWLPDLEGAGRNVVLPADATPGRMLVIFNSSSDGTYKWTFTGEDVEDASGAAITTLTDQKSYTLIYFGGKFRVTAIN